MHTPAPWRVEHDPCIKGDPLTLIMPADGKMYNKFIARCEFDAKGDGVADCTVMEAQHNAAHIVLAVNCHDDLLAACKAMIVAIDTGEVTSNVVNGRVWRACQEMRDAIAKAEGK